MENVTMDDIINELKETSGLSWEKLAHKLGTTPRTLWEIRKGSYKRQIRFLKNLKRLCQKYSIDYWLIFEEEE